VKFIRLRRIYLHWFNSDKFCVAKQSKKVYKEELIFTYFYFF